MSIFGARAAAAARTHHPPPPRTVKPFLDVVLREALTSLVIGLQALFKSEL